MSAADKDYSFGVSEFTTWPWSFERDMAEYSSLGVDAIEITEFKLDREGFAGQLRSLRESGLGVSSVQTAVHSLFKDSLVGEPPDPKQRLETMKDSLRKLAPHVPPGTPFVVITGAAPAGDCARVLHQAVGAFGELAQLAASLHMRIAFEALNPILFHTDTALWSLDDALTLVKRVDHPALGLCVDLWNIWQTPDLAGVIRQAGERIFLVQVSDWRTPHANADRRSLGDGDIPIASILSTLRSAGYRGPYVLEIFSSQSVPDSLWNGDLRATLRKNIEAFKHLWRRSLAA